MSAPSGVEPAGAGPYHGLDRDDAVGGDRIARVEDEIEQDALDLEDAGKHAHRLVGQPELQPDPRSGHARQHGRCVRNDIVEVQHAPDLAQAPGGQHRAYELRRLLAAPVQLRDLAIRLSGGDEEIVGAPRHHRELALHVVHHLRDGELAGIDLRGSRKRGRWQIGLGRDRPSGAREQVLQERHSTGKCCIQQRSPAAMERRPVLLQSPSTGPV